MDAYNQAELQSHLEALGVEAGAVLFIHSSFKSLGPVAGGAQTVVDALQAAVDPDGLILMPSFHLIERSERARRWDWATTPSTVGWLTEFFRCCPIPTRYLPFESLLPLGSGPRA